MILFGTQIIAALNANSGNFTIPDVTVKDSYDPSKPLYPLVVLTELPSDDGILVDGQPRIVSNTYTIECYCKPTDLGEGIILSASNASKVLGVEVNTFLNQTYNLTQVGDSFSAPLIQDKTVNRFVARYSTTIDQETGYIYR